MPTSHPRPPECHWFSALAAALDPRSAPRLAWLLVGAVLARGRRTVTSWIRAAGLSAEFRPSYTAVLAAGKRTDLMAAHLVREVVKPLVAGADRLTFALDDTPTDRSGRHVQGAGVHHNPTPGPAGGPFVYGHVWVVLGLLARHPAWGVVALPLLVRMYVRQKNLSGIAPKHRPLFRTKLELAVELVGWAVSWLGHLGKPVWVVVDGAYAKAPFFRPMRALKVTTVSRLRKDSALWTVPGPRAPHRRGPNRTYGEQRIALAKRAGQTRGWTIGAFHLCLWTFTMTEAWAWNRDEKALIEHRSASPWDNGARRPSQADKRRARRRELLGNEIRAVLRPGTTEQELQAAAERMLQLAA